MRYQPLVLTALALGAPLASIAAQLPSSSAAASGLGENFTATARGFHAAAWNPAGLGMPGNPRFSIGVGGRGEAGLAPVSLGDIAQFDGEVLPDDVRAAWLARIRLHGSMRVSGEIGGSGFAMSRGRFAFQIGGQTHALGELAPDAAEVILFGNAGQTGEARELSFAGTGFLTTMVTTAAMSYARPIAIRLGPLPDQHFALGATAKYIVGNGMAMGRDRSSGASSAPLEVRVDFPVVQSHASLGDFGKAGSGVGLDVGASWQAGAFAAGAVVQNVINTFAWSVDDFYWRAGQATYDANGSTTDFDSLHTMADAPADVRAGVTDLRFAPVVSLGGSWTMSPRATLVADVRRRVGEGAMNAGDATHVGAGVELRAARVLPVRFGGAMVSGGYRIAGGAGLELGWLNLAASIGRRSVDGGSDNVLAATASIVVR